MKKFFYRASTKHHANGKYIFWSDKASSHYAKKTLEYLEQKKIPYVPNEGT